MLRGVARRLRAHLPVTGAVMIGASLSLLAMWAVAAVAVEILSPGSTSDLRDIDWKWTLGALAVALAPGVGGLALFAIDDVTHD